MLLPGAVQQWIWAAAGGPPIRPSQATSTDMVSDSSLRLIVVKPVAVLAFGGTSFSPDMGALNTKMAALAGAAQARNAARAAVTRNERNMQGLLTTTVAADAK